MAQLSAAESKVVDWIAGERATVLDLIETLVNTDSGSLDKAGVDAAGAHIRTFLHQRGIASDVVPNARYGDGIRATVAGSGVGTILLMGHRDTVYTRGEAARRPFRVAGGRGSGPGCCDMKAGLAMNALVLAAFAQFGAPGPLVGLFTADEEIGSPSSKALIEEEARRARAVFNAEPGRPNGGVVTGRKGGVFMRLDVTGKAAHAGNDRADGISAIEEIARKVIELHRLTDRERGITCNVGTIAGCAQDLGQAVREEFAGGCADSGFAASVGAPTICGVGPIGGRAHSPDEYLEVDTIIPRAQALALAVMRLG